MIGLAHLGGPIACLGLALLLVAKTQRERIAGLGFAAFGACVLGAAVAPHRPVELLGGAFAALGIGLGLALAFRRLPWLFPVLALACVPARIGVHVGHSSTKLLLPLYIVILGATILLAWDLIAGDKRVRELQAVAWPLAAYLAWTGISISWSRDISEGAIELLAFYLPFVLLALGIARLPWSELGLRALYVQITVMAVAFAAIGFYQYDTRNIFQNPKLGNSNAYAPFFRVNSVFWDPSVYGRFLVIAMAPSVLLVVLGRSLRLSVAALSVLVVTWLGLLISFSQSSFAALLVVVVKLRATLHMALDWASRKQWIRWNAAVGVEIPKTATAPTRRKSLSVDEVDRLIVAAQDDEMYGAIWVTMLAVGLRPGAGDGLGRNDVDREKRGCSPWSTPSLASQTMMVTRFFGSDR